MGEDMMDVSVVHGGAEQPLLISPLHRSNERICSRLIHTHPSTVRDALPLRLNKARKVSTHHNVTCTPVQGHTKVLDIPILSKKILQILLGSLLIQSSDDDDPSFDGYLMKEQLMI